MNIFGRMMHKVLGCNGKSMGETNVELNGLRHKVLKEKKNDIKDVKKTNNTIKVMIQSGVVELKVIGNK